ncbi:MULTISPECIES: DUF4064 domain-containing protein [Rossellomorea]|jgi:hypothetical protein|uniref:DUF4064 domain-containing protein n=1 Tax=Rossellomorea aquimaris TaxID=189382 RepID=A0A5D4UVH8_9BACI|nr:MULTISPECIES: DUF4064 domain-containing protein [Rossellomorea]MDT9024220.1 DUF4064 domain-containing protein [Rossellomorea sp. YC4-1]TYS78815.1 DUF4064 domain-containing protein [Rossellomorea aquimaris]TYS84560.1 DUF4064 domain-containing protein [Rossellomorea aquimaris]TYS91522.1 DUF4064 domain-containing protein [Rossellomorea aquimaris]
MVKRTGEVVMGVIGIILSALFSIIGIVLNMGMSNPEVMSQLEEGMESDPNIQNAEMNAGDISSIINAAESTGSYLVILGIIASILGIIAVLTIVKNKKPVLSGIMFIIAALVIGIGTIGFGFVPGLLFLIAGIMALVRKPKKTDPVY